MSPARPTFLHRYRATLLGGAFFSLLLSALLAHDHVVFHSGPAFLIGRPIGAACSHADQCRAPLGTATRRAYPKTCASTREGAPGVCASICEDGAECPAGFRCEPRISHVNASESIEAHVCVPERER